MVRIGIIGMGLRATVYADAVHNNIPEATIAAVADLNDTRAADAAKKYGCKAYSDYKEMVKENNLDAVLITTPDFAHREAAVFCAEHKLHMLVEKPFATTTEDCEAMAEAIQKNNLKCTIGLENRWNIPFVAAKEQIDAGVVGEVATTNITLNDTIYVPTKMFPWADKSSPGWFLLPHALDMACWLGNKKVKSVYTTGTKKVLKAMGIDTYDSMQTNVIFTDGTSGAFMNSWIAPESMPLLYDFKCEILGSKSTMYIDTQNQMVKVASPEHMTNVHALGTPVYGRPTQGAYFLIADFVKNIIEDTKPIVNEIVGMENAIGVEAAHISLETGKIVEL